MTSENICFYLQNRLIQTSQTGGQWYIDTSPFSIPCLDNTAMVVSGTNSIYTRKIFMQSAKASTMEALKKESKP
jgi:hypothetical protein